MEMWEAHCEYEKELDRLEWRKLAQLASWITSPHVKKPVDPLKLLGEKGGSGNKGKPKMKKEDAKQELEGLKKQFGG